MEKPSNGNRHSAAEIGGVVHVARGQEATKFGYISRDEPASIVSQIDRFRVFPTAGKARERNVRTVSVVPRGELAFRVLGAVLVS